MNQLTLIQLIVEHHIKTRFPLANIEEVHTHSNEAITFFIEHEGSLTVDVVGLSMRGLILEVTSTESFYELCQAIRADLIAILEPIKVVAGITYAFAHGSDMDKWQPTARIATEHSKELFA